MDYNISMSYSLELVRKAVVKQGRGMIRVRYKDTGALVTAAVCPGCWNDADRRFVLLKQMDKMSVEPVHKHDLIDGVYRDKKHFEGCPHKVKIDKSWKNFERVLKKKINKTG